jgi:hypothetical protein
VTILTLAIVSILTGLVLWMLARTEPSHNPPPTASPPPKRSTADIVGIIFILAIGLQTTLLVGAIVGLSSFSCSGGFMGESCSGGSPLLGLLAGGTVAAFFGFLAWSAGRSGH